MYCRDFASCKSQRSSRGAAKLKFVKQSESEIQDLSWTRLERVCREVSVKDNFYLSWLLRGGRGYNPLIRPDYCPPYLTNDSFEKLKVSSLSPSLPPSLPLSLSLSLSRGWLIVLWYTQELLRTTLQILLVQDPPRLKT